MQYLLVTAPALRIGWSSSPAHQKLFPFLFHLFPICGKSQWISQGCLPTHTHSHTHKNLQHFILRGSSWSPSSTPGVSPLVEPLHPQLKEPPPFHRTASRFLPALKIAATLRILCSLPELPAAKETRALFSEISWNNGNPWMECPGCGQELKAALDFLPQCFCTWSCLV